MTNVSRPCVKHVTTLKTCVFINIVQISRHIFLMIIFYKYIFFLKSVFTNPSHYFISRMLLPSDVIFLPKYTISSTRSSLWLPISIYLRVSGTDYNNIVFEQFIFIYDHFRISLKYNLKSFKSNFFLWKLTDVFRIQKYNLSEWHLKCYTNI